MVNIKYLKKYLIIKRDKLMSELIKYIDYLPMRGGTKTDILQSYTIELYFTLFCLDYLENIKI